MIGKLALAFSAPLLLSNSEPLEPTYVSIPQVKMVECGMVRGTAWRNGTGSYVTARHVTHGRECYIEGERVNVTWESEELDMATIRTSVWGEGLPIDCSGYRDGGGYVGVGHAKGLPFQRAIFVVASDALTLIARWGLFTTMIGEERFIPGMSGGVVLSREGKAVGIVNGYNRLAPLSYSQSLSETPLCGDQA
jgi:hypothetical protein